MYRIFSYLLFLTFLPLSLQAIIGNLSEGHSLQIGPETYHIKRFRDGGSFQKGWLYGGRFAYERKLRYSPYLALELIYAEGCAKGSTGSNESLKSKLYEFDIESRLGYTFEAKHGLKQSFTPFSGCGFFSGRNRFIPPSATLCIFNTKFHHIMAGFLAEITAGYFKFGMRVAAKYMWCSKNTITADFLPNPIKQLIDDRWHYEFSFPIDYFLCKEDDRWKLRLMPYWKKRHYGEREHFIADYKETKFYIKGLNISCNFTF